MPELPEVETVRRALLPHLVGATVTAVVVRTERLRRPVPCERLQKVLPGNRITGLERRGKYLLAELETGGALVLHLGMTGTLRVCPAPEPFTPWDRVAWTLTARRQLRLQDVRRFSIVDCFPQPEPIPEYLKRLGPEPLGKRFTADYLIRVFQGRVRPVKNALLDQTIVAGLGNIYVNEALFAAGIRPERPAGSLRRGEASRLLRAIRNVLRAALEAGGSTIHDFRLPDGSEGSFAQQLAVYGRTGKACPRCKHPIRQSRLGGRGTFFCPNCQK